VTIAGLCNGFGEASFNMTDAMLEEVRPMMEKQSELVRFYSLSQTDIEQALASGEVVAFYGWNAAFKNLSDQGIPVAYA